MLVFNPLRNTIDGIKDYVVYINIALIIFQIGTKIFKHEYTIDFFLFSLVSYVLHTEIENY